MSEALPRIASRLADLLVKDGLGLYRDGIISLEECSSSVSIVVERDGRRIRFSLSVELDDEEGRDEEDRT